MAAVTRGPLAYLKLLRPRQGAKNVLCLAGVLFSGRFAEPEHHYVLQALLTFVSFSAVSSATYVFNDILDRDRDRQHPRKRQRPIASGAVSVPAAVLIGLLVGAGGVVLAAALGTGVLVCLLLYVANTIAYSSGVKHLVLLDVLSIALGFVLRLLAGVYAVEDTPTTWITLCTFFLALFIAFGKRRAELATLATTEDQKQRPVLSQYTVPYLDAQVSSSAVMAVVCYALFTTTSGKNPTLVVTVPIVYYAIMHYKRLLVLLEKGEEPERIVLSDIRILASVLLWLASYLAIVYGKVELFRQGGPG
jgi:4-hydroxybenzoate polyprenyltransferase